MRKAQRLMDSPNRNPYRTLVIVLIVAASVLRVIVCVQHNPMDYLFSDMARHWRNGGAFPRGGYLGAADPIMYQWYVYILRILTRDTPLAVAFSAAALSVIMPWTYYRAAREFGMQKTAALWVWALIAWTPSLFTIYHYIMMETLLLLVDGVALWMTARYLRKGTTGAFLDSLVAWTVACLTKPTVAPLAAVCVLWSIWRKATPWREIAIGGLAALLLLVPQAVRSKKELGFYAPFGNPWLTRIQHRSGMHGIRLKFHGPFHDEDQQYYSPSCFIRPLWPLSSWAIRRASTNSVVTVRADYRNGSRDWSDAYKGLPVGREEWFAQWRENILVSLFAPSWPESNSQLWDSRLDFYARWLWAPLILLVLAWNLRTFFRRTFELVPVSVTVFTLCLVLQNVVTAEGRYRKPLEPLLLFNLVWLICEHHRQQLEKEKPDARVRNRI